MTSARADVEYGKNICMRERRSSSRLLLESPKPFRILGKLRRHHLHRDVAIQPWIAGPVHFAHSSRANRVEDFITVEFGASFKSHRAREYTSDLLTASLLSNSGSPLSVRVVRLLFRN